MAEFETREPDWLSFDEALERLEAVGSPLDASPLPLAETLGLAVAEEVTARLTLPPGPTSHMDGYALRASDVSPSADRSLSIPVPVLGVSRPGAPWPEPLPVGSAIRIMTGALLPRGADTVVPVEETDRERESSGSVRIQLVERPEGSTPRPGRYVRPAGEEITEGERLAGPGDTVTPGLLSLVAATGRAELTVHRPPVVALIVTGSELVAHGDPAALEGGVRRADILSPSIPPLLAAAGAVALAPRRVGDDEKALTRTLSEAAEQADVIITTGGASMGEADLVKRVLAKMHFSIDFWRVRMRPGSPISVGRLPTSIEGRRLLVVGLPGNPVSAIVTLLVFGLPAIRALGGHARRFLPKVRVTAGERFAGPPHLTRFYRVVLEPEASGTLVAKLSGSQGSGVIRSLAGANGLAVVPEGTDAIEEGDPVDVLLIPFATWGVGHG